MQLIPDIAIGPVRMFDNFRRFGRICSVISVGSVRFGSVTGFIHSRNYVFETGSMTGILGQLKWESLKKRRKDSINTGLIWKN